MPRSCKIRNIMYFSIDIRNNTYYNNNVNRKEMKTVKTSELIKLLKKAGCTYVRDGGNHGIWYSPITGKTFPVWYHNKEIPTGTLNKIKKEAGI